MKEWRVVLMSRIWGVSASLRCKWVMSHMWVSECRVKYIWMNERFSCHSTHVTNINGKVHVLMSHIPPAPMNHVKKFKVRPLPRAFSELVLRLYKLFPPDRFCQVENDPVNPTSNKRGTRGIYEWMSASHVTQLVSHIWIGKCMSSCHTYECVRASLRCECVMPHVWMRKHQRMSFRYVPAKQWEMTPISPCVDTQCIAMCCSALQCVAMCCSVLQCVEVCCSVLRRPWMKEQRRDNPDVTLCRHAARSCPQKGTTSRQRSHVCLQTSPISPQKKALSWQKRSLYLCKRVIYLCKRALKRDKRERESLRPFTRPLYKKAQYLCTRALYIRKKAVYLYKRAPKGGAHARQFFAKETYVSDQTHNIHTDTHLFSFIDGTHAYTYTYKQAHKDTDTET